MEIEEQLGLPADPIVVRAAVTAGRVYSGAGATWADIAVEDGG